MYIKVIFFESGVPKTGLSPTIDIYKVSDNALVEASMTEIPAGNGAGGVYKYDFTVYDPAEEYVYIADSVALAGSERYSVGSIDPIHPDLANGGRLDALIDLILADTGDLQSNQGAWATAVGFSTHDAAAVKTAIEAGGSSLAQILADTGELQVDDTPAAIAALPTAAEIKTAMEAGGSSLALIKDVTDALTSAAATKLALSAGTIVSDTVDTGYTETTTTLKGGGTASLSAVNEHYNGRIILFVSGTLQNQATDITGYVGATKVFTFTALTSAPTDADEFIIV